MHAPSIKLIKEGYLLKQSIYLKRNRKRWIILHSNRIDCYKDNNKQTITESFDLTVYDEVRASSIDCCFELISSENNIIRLFTAVSTQQMMEWIQNIENAQNTLKTNILPINKNEQKQQILHINDTNEPQPPSYQQHHTRNKYDYLPTTPNDSNSDQESDEHIKPSNEIQTTRQINVDDTVAELLSLNPNTAQQPLQTAPNNTESGKVTIQRLGTIQRLTTFHEESIKRTNSGWINIKSGFENIGFFEIVMIVSVIYVFSCCCTPIYGIYGGYVLNDLWNQYDIDGINNDCNNKYISEFTYRPKKRRRRKERFGGTFNGMIIFGYLEIAIFIIIFCIYCYRKFVENRYNDSELASVMLWYGCCGALMFSFVWFFNFITCIQFRDTVFTYCDPGTVIYNGTIDIFSWLYPLCVFVILKGCMWVTLWCVWFACENK